MVKNQNIDKHQNSGFFQATLVLPKIQTFLDQRLFQRFDFKKGVFLFLKKQKWFFSKLQNWPLQLTNNKAFFVCRFCNFFLSDTSFDLNWSKVQFSMIFWPRFLKTPLFIFQDSVLEKTQNLAFDVIFDVFKRSGISHYFLSKSSFRKNTKIGFILQKIHICKIAKNSSFLKILSVLPKNQTLKLRPKKPLFIRVYRGQFLCFSKTKVSFVKIAKFGNKRKLLIYA